MQEHLRLVCDSPDCERALTPEEFRLSFATAEVQRQVYECPCGAVTITVSRGARH